MEQKVKKRGWVKNAAIIFLVVLLLLTFMSNTIRNASLPEVAAQYVQSGTINAKIRGTGTVTANESYEVKTAQTRTVQSVSVKVGDEVSTDDMLLLFADMESKELTDAEAALEALMVEYKTALVDATNSDYAAETAAINQAQAALDRARINRNALIVSDTDQVNAQQMVTNAKAAVVDQQALVSRLEAELAAAPAGGTAAEISAARQKVNDKQSELFGAQSDLTSTRIVYDGMYTLITDYAWKMWVERTGGSSVNPPPEYVLQQYREAVAKAYKDELKIDTPTSANSPAAATPLYCPSQEPTDDEKAKMVTAYDAISNGTDLILTKQKELATLQTTLSALENTERSRINTSLTNAKSELTRLQDAQKTAEENLAAIKQKKTEVKEADAAVTAAEADLQNKMIALAEKQKTDGKSQSKEQIALADKQYKMAQQNKLIKKLKENATGAGLTSPVNGKVTSVGISAGGTTSPDKALMTIEVPDRGYSLSFSVTTEKSKKVRVGDKADILYNYYGADKSATLEGIKTDPDKPGTNRLLVFSLSGDVQAGEQMTISIGEKGQYYDTIVPNSAIRSDNNGSFVLVVEAKSSPLGNRYIARRADVQIMGSDDVNTGVTGSFSGSDFVVTTSNRPIEPGMQVRLAE